MASLSRGRKKQRISLAYLAQELGVSRTTVSNAYNRPEELSPELRAKILNKAEALGYAGPDPMARSLRTKRVGSLGILLTEELTYAFEDQASVDLLAGMAKACSGSQNTLTLIPVGPNTYDDLDALNLVNQAVVDGFVVYSVAKRDPYLEAVAKRSLPTIICDQPNDDPRFPFIGIDDYAAIAPAAQSLVDAGHRKIGILCIRLSPEAHNGQVTARRLQHAAHHVQKARVLGALDVFRAAGIDPQSVPIIERHINDRANNYSAAEQLLTTYPELTAVLCTTDTMAFGVLEYACTHGIVVPEDLSVTGFDGIDRALTRNLTTVIQMNKDKGMAAGRVLTAMIQGQDVPARTPIATEFHHGQTVAKPA